MLEFIILGVLNNRCLTGYDIRKYIEQGIGLFYKASFGSIYPILDSLSKRGLVEYNEEAHGKRMTKLYKITEIGRIEFISWLDNKECSNTDEFMAVIYFLDQLPRERAEQKINSYINSIDSYLEKLMKKKEHYEEYENADNYYYMMSTLKYGIYTLNNLKKWCSQLSEHKKLE